jgi:hypothetical protein
MQQYQHRPFARAGLFLLLGTLTVLIRKSAHRRQTVLQSTPWARAILAIGTPAANSLRMLAITSEKGGPAGPGEDKATVEPIATLAVGKARSFPKPSALFSLLFHPGLFGREIPQTPTSNPAAKREKPGVALVARQV